MMFKNLSKNFLINLLLVLSICLFDRASKIYVVYLDKKIFGYKIYSSKFLDIQLVWNEGIAFGLLSFNESTLYNLLTVLIALVILAIFFMSIQSEGLKKYSLLMILGGALGNLFDRVFYESVPDFIDFHVGNFHWFIFNVADIFITLGVIFMIFLEFTDNSGVRKNE